MGWDEFNFILFDIQDYFDRFLSWRDLPVKILGV